MTKPIVIIGAGLAGLCCALELADAGHDFLLLDASDRVGGRIKTDIVNGFKLDRGFQVLLDSYPEVSRRLVLRDLKLQKFLPGAKVRFGGEFHSVTDPFRRPLEAIPTVFSPIGSLFDKLRVAFLRADVLKDSTAKLFAREETTTLERLRSAGFSDLMIERFFRPFLGGIFLEGDLNTSSRMFDFVFQMFSTGNACLPAEGMEAIPRALAATLPSSKLRLNTTVSSIEEGVVILENGERLEASAIVVASDALNAAKLLGDEEVRKGVGVTCVYFSVPIAPLTEPVLVINGEGKGPINNLCFPTQVASVYGPEGTDLASVTVLGSGHDAAKLLTDVREQLTEWFGSEVNKWEHLKTYEIDFALPAQEPPALTPPERDVRVRPGVYVCGDHIDNASIQGAMVSGRRAATALLEDLH